LNDSSAIDQATRRLAAALDGLDAALDRRQVADKGDISRAAELQALGNDRARLASELDAAVARTRRLEAANREIAQRLDSAMGTIRQVLEANDR
jgi:predicted  nucleic acid-binding Zn-ribbon protein